MSWINGTALAPCHSSDDDLCPLCGSVLESSPNVEVGRRTPTGAAWPDGRLYRMVSVPCLLCPNCEHAEEKR